MASDTGQEESDNLSGSDIGLEDFPVSKRFGFIFHKRERKGNGKIPSLFATILSFLIFIIIKFNMAKIVC